METISLKCKECGAPIRIESISNIKDQIVECDHCHSVCIIKASHSEMGSKAEASIELINAKYRNDLEKVKFIHFSEEDKKKTQFKRKMIIAVGYLVIMFILMVPLFVMAYLEENGNPFVDTVTVKKDYYDFKGENFKDAENDLSDMGFTNIKVKKIKDIKYGIFTKDGEVDRVTINGDSEFKEDERFNADSKVKIYYHTFMEKK